MSSKKIPIGQLLPNPNNPRTIRGSEFELLCDNIAKHPRLLSIRPIIVESRKNPIILGGNMRYCALCHLGYKELPAEWIKYADELTPEDRQAFIILDNRSFGDWDYEALANEWSAEQLKDWGVDVPTLTIEEEREPGDSAGGTGEKEATIPSFMLEVIFPDEEAQIRTYNSLSGKGYHCKIVNK